MIPNGNDHKLVDQPGCPAEAGDDWNLPPDLYREMKVAARKCLHRASPGQSLNPTALVHEAYLKLSGQEPKPEMSRSHFLAMGAMTMRQIIVSYHRRTGARKRGGDFQRVEFNEANVISSRKGDDVLALEEALEKLEQVDEKRAKLVVMRFYGGLTIEEIAEAMGVSARTVKYSWASTRTWLRRELAAG